MYTSDVCYCIAVYWYKLAIGTEMQIAMAHYIGKGSLLQTKIKRDAIAYHPDRDQKDTLLASIESMGGLWLPSI